jgi:transcriptional regulator with XRE-family HTH domain
MPRQERALDTTDPWAPTAQQLRELRQAANLTYQQMAQRAPYSSTALSMTAATGGATVPSWAKVEAFVKACGVTDPGELGRWRQSYDETVDAVRRAGVRGPHAGAAAPSPVLVQTWPQFTDGLRALRTRAGLSYQQLVDGSGGVLAKSTISDLLTGRIRPTETTVRAFLTVCQQRIDFDADEWLAALRRVQSTPEPGARTTTPAEPTRQSNRPRPEVEAPVSRTPTSTDASNVSLRALAAAGLLASHVRNAPNAERRSLFAQAYEIAAPIVFTLVTRGAELARGHRGCASGPQMLLPACHDSHQDDVKAVIDDLLERSVVPIAHIEGWIATRITSAVVNAHRRRRGARGALQRPRPPRWLVTALGDDPWLTDLAVQVLLWVGVPHTAGAGLWPLDAWADRRRLITGDATAGRAAVSRDLDQVLDAMRDNPRWYELYVERPLGHKEPPLLPEREFVRGQAVELAALDDTDDSQLRVLASEAIEAITHRINQGHDPQTVVPEVIAAIFNKQDRVEERDLLPGDSSLDDRVAGILTDPDTMNRIVTTVVGLLHEPEPAPAPN